MFFCTQLGFAFGKTAYYFLLVSSKICVLAFYCSFRDMRADRQTDRQTDVLITLLRTANKKPLKIALENRCRSGSYASHHNVRHAAKKTARRRQLYVTDIVVLARRRPPSHGRRTDGRTDGSVAATDVAAVRTCDTASVHPSIRPFVRLCVRACVVKIDSVSSIDRMRH